MSTSSDVRETWEAAARDREAFRNIQKYDRILAFENRWTTAMLAALDLVLERCNRQTCFTVRRYQAPLICKRHRPTDARKLTLRGFPTDARKLTLRGFFSKASGASTSNPATGRPGHRAP